MISAPPLAIALSLVLGQAPAAAQTPAPPAAAPQPPAAQGPAPQRAPPADLKTRVDEALASPPMPGGRPLTLDEALRLADERNQDLKAAFARLQQAEQGYWKAWAGYLPQVVLGATYTHNGDAVTLPFPVATSPSSPTGLAYTEVTVVPSTQLQGTADASQMLFSPALWFAIRSASQGSDSARDATENVRRQILYGTANAFYGVATLREAAQISDRLLEIARRQEKDARVRYQAGTIAKVGLLRAEIDRARAEQDVVRSRNAYQSARLALAQLIDSPLDFDVMAPEQPRLPADTSRLIESALRDRADVRSARSALGAAESAHAAIVGAYLPNVAAFGHYQNANVAGLTGQELWSVGLSLQWRIFDGGLREANYRETNARIVEARANLASTELTARREVGQALLDLESARANAQKSKEQRELAAENQRLVDVSYRAGSATAVEQADATAQLRNAEIGALTDALGTQVAALRVLQASGATLR